jgi:ATP-dependent RNA helicase RhlE
MNMKDLNLTPALAEAVADMGYDEPTPSQQRAIPVILEGRDLIGCASTGTGKTAAFLLPMLQNLSRPPGEVRQQHRGPRALILTPTRELAAQVNECARDYGRHLSIRSTAIFGGVGFNPQVSAIRSGCDIVIATPGRLLDHLQQRTLDLSRVEIFVLDEADRMLDMGFIRDIRRIGNHLPKQRQTLLFSATFSAEIRALANDFLHRPTEVAATPRNTAAERVEQIVYPVDKDRKRELLSHSIGAGNWRQVLVFTRTKHGADRLARQLGQDGLSAMAIHGNKSQGARTRALADFKAGRVRVLVATDIAARGLDIERLPHVVNYELPEVPEDYVHRIGRTARAGEDGQAISLVCSEEKGLLSGIEKLLRTELTRTVVPGYECSPASRQRPTGDSTEQRSARPNGRRRHPGGTGSTKAHSGRSRKRGNAR